MDQVSPDSSEAIGRSLRTLRKHAGLTLEELAALADTSVAYLSKVETGRYAPSRTYVTQVTSAIANAMKAAA